MRGLAIVLTPRNWAAILIDPEAHRCRQRPRHHVPRRLVVLLAQVTPGPTVDAASARPSIVVLRPGVAVGERDISATRTRARHVARTVARSASGITIRYRFDAALGGFAARLTPAQLERLAHASSVARILAHAPVEVTSAVALGDRLRADRQAGVSDAQSTPVGIRRIGGATWSGSYGRTGARR